MGLSGKFFKAKSQPSQDQQNQSIQTSQNQEQQKGFLKESIQTNLDDNLSKIKELLGNSSDVVYRTFILSGKRNIHLAIIYIDGLADAKSIQHYILESMMLKCEEKLQQSPKADEFSIFKDFAITIGEIKTVNTWEDVTNSIMSGDSAVLIDGYAEAIITGTKGWQDRGVTEPTSQNIVRGPKDGFSETLRTNTALIRRRIRDVNLRVDSKNVGTVTKTDIAVIYIEGIADPEIVKEVHSRIDKINIDAILESGYIEELIQDETYTPFPTIYSTERPDVIIANILEGRIGIIIDGTPFALSVPAIFTEFFHASEDYYQRAEFSTLVRILRLSSFLLTLLVPAAYIAVTTFDFNYDSYRFSSRSRLDGT